MVLKVGTASALPLAGPAKNRDATCVLREGEITALNSSGYVEAKV